MASLEWTIATRYLKLPRPRPWSIFIPSLVVALLLAICQGGLWWLTRRSPFALDHASHVAMQVLRVGTLVTMGAFVILTVLLALIRRYTIFTSISTFGLFLGSAALVIVLSVMSGFESDLKKKILGANAHLLVTTPDRAFDDYQDVAARLARIPGVQAVSPYLSAEVMISSQSNLAGVILKGIDPGTAGTTTELARTVEQGKLEYLDHPEKILEEPPPPGFDEEVPRLKKGEAGPDAGAASSDGGVPRPDPRDPFFKDAPAAQGQDQGQEQGQPAAPEVTTEKKKVVEFLATDSHGNVLERAAKRKKKVLPGVLIGRELSRNLRLFVGDEVNVVSPMGDIGPAGSMPRSRPFRVAGIFYTGMYEYDSKYIYLSMSAAQKFLGEEDQATGVELRIAAVDDPDETAALLRAELAGVSGTTGGFEVQTWQQLNRNLFAALRVEKIAMFVVLCFIILVAGFSIVANGIMLVREKERHIAILKSMGATDPTILRAFLYVGLHMGAIGVGAGIGAGVIACLLLARYGLALDSEVYYISQLPVQIDPLEIAAVLLATVGIALAATVYPALIAARLRPVDGLRLDQH